MATALTAINQAQAPPLALPPPTIPPIGSMSPSALAPSMSTLPALPPPTLPNVTGPLSQLALDTNGRDRMINSGSGISQIKNPVLRGIAQALDITGSVFTPHLESMIPGTQGHHQVLLHQQAALIAGDQAQQEQQAKDANLAADTARTTAQTAALQNPADRNQVVQTDDGNYATIDSTTGKGKLVTGDDGQPLGAPTKDPGEPSLAQAYAHAVTQAIKAGTDPQADPIVQHLSQAIVALQPGQNKAPDAPKTIQLQGPDGKDHQMGFNAQTGKYDVDMGIAGEKPPVTKVVSPASSEAALDREAKQFGAPHQKSLDASNAQLEKIADARAMINGNAEAQGLGIPKVLTALVGGQGTGVRITQAELTSIAHARGLSGDVEGTLNKLSGQGALSKAQQVQLTQIMDDVRARILQKQAIASSALDTINGASSRDQIIAADKAARKQLSDMETGGPQNSGPKVGDVEQGHRFKGGNPADPNSWEKVK